MNQTAWVAGASGLVGRELARRLATHPAYQRVVALVRDGAAELEEISGLTVHQVNFQQLRETLPPGPVDHVYCALGSTKNKTPNQGDFRAIDVLHPLTIAKAAQAAGASTFAVVSAPGAHPFSRFMYLQLKGELENRLQAMNFPHLVIAQPGLLLGERRERRTLEDFLTRHRWLHRLMPARMRPIPAATVASALIVATTGAGQGVQHLRNTDLVELARVDRENKPR